MKQSKKTSMIMVAIVVVLILILILIFSNIGRILGFESNENSLKKNNYTDEQLNAVFEEKGKYKVSIVNSEYAQLTKAEANGIDSFIDLILNSINNKTSNDLYGKLLDSYKSIKFKSQEEFDEYLKKEFPNTDYECVSYNLEALNAFIKVRSLSVQDEIHTIKLYGEDFSDLEQTKIIFGSYNFAERAGGMEFLDEVIIKVKNLVFYSDKNSVYMEIKNGSNKLLKLDFYESEVIKRVGGVEKKTISKSSSYVEIPAKQTGYVEVFFNNSDVFVMEPDECKFKMKINGREEVANIWFLYEDPSI